METLAERVGTSMTSSVTNLLKFDHDIQWSVEQVRVDVHNTGQPAVGFLHGPGHCAFCVDARDQERVDRGVGSRD